jgi:hypothetical protein
MAGMVESWALGEPAMSDIGSRKQFHLLYSEGPANRLERMPCYRYAGRCHIIAPQLT